MSNEKVITLKTKRLLNEYKVLGLPIFFWKVSDRYTSGIPDYQGTFYGIPFYLELKGEGEELRKLQKWTIDQCAYAGALTLATDSYEEVVRFFEDIRINHVFILKQRYLSAAAERDYA